MLTEGKQDCDSKYALEGIYWGALLVERKKKKKKIKAWIQSLFRPL